MRRRWWSRSSSSQDAWAQIAASHGISLERLYALNPELGPLTNGEGETIVVGLR
jgi:hypothetical protein